MYCSRRVHLVGIALNNGVDVGIVLLISSSLFLGALVPFVRQSCFAKRARSWPFVSRISRKGLAALSDEYSSCCTLTCITPSYFDISWALVMSFNLLGRLGVNLNLSLCWNKQCFAGIPANFLRESYSSDQVSCTNVKYTSINRIFMVRGRGV